jgi:hypothetical protein
MRRRERREEASWRPLRPSRSSNRARFHGGKEPFAASEIGLFAALAAAPLKLDALAERIGVPRHTARIVFDTMISIGILEKDDDRHRNGAVAAAFLAGGREAGRLAAIRSYQTIGTAPDGRRRGKGRTRWQ